MTNPAGPWSPGGNCLGCSRMVACGTLNMCLDKPTDAARLDSVTRAVEYMSSHIGEPQRLADIAQAALLSPFHFHRVFRHITSTTPARFLTALRMAEARRLLVCSDQSVTDVCLAVGYSSLGTFISQFKKFTGLSPRRFRSTVSRYGGVRLMELVHGRDAHVTPGPVGTVTGGPREGGCAVLALYHLESQEDGPVAYRVLETNRVSKIEPLADGTYQAVALGFGPSSTLSDVLSRTVDPAEFVGSGSAPIVVSDGRSHRSFHVALRRPRRLDPPMQLTSVLLNIARGAGRN